MVSFVASAACSHNYIYRPDNLPEIRGGKLLYVSAEDEQRELLTVERVTVVRLSRPTVFERPTHEELKRIGRREVLPELEAVRFKVSTAPRVWSEYALVGLGLGISIGAMLGVAAAEQEEGAAMIPIVVGIALGVGLEGMLIGAAVGSIATQGTTDLRLDGRRRQREEPVPPAPAPALPGESAPAPAAGPPVVVDP